MSDTPRMDAAVNSRGYDGNNAVTEGKKLERELAAERKQIRHFLREIIAGQQPCDYGKWPATEARFRAGAEELLKVVGHE